MRAAYKYGQQLPVGLRGPHRPILAEPSANRVLTLCIEMKPRPDAAIVTGIVVSASPTRGTVNEQALGSGEYIKRIALVIVSVSRC